MLQLTLVSFSSRVDPLDACVASTPPHRPFNQYSCRIIIPRPLKGAVSIGVSFGEVMKLTMEANGPQMRHK